MRISVSIILLFACLNGFAQKLDIQGHRGARGLMPENTIPSFIKALDEGVTTLELDVVITKDKKVLVSHDTYMSSAICSFPDGSPVQKDDTQKLNIYEMTYAEVQKYDCGSRGNAGFPDQEKVKVTKPLLSDMITQIEAYISKNNLPKVNYNIEIKSGESGDGKNHPGVQEFVALTLAETKKYLPYERFNIQSFDFRMLQEIHTKDPKVTLAVLIGGGKDIQTHLDKLGFVPEIYSPHYGLLSKKDIEFCHEKGMKVIPWTVNDLEAMQKLVDEGVDGIITDYPNKAKALKQ